MNYKIFLSIILVTLITSCSLVNVVDELPPHALVPENVIFNEESAEKLLLGVYSDFRVRGYNDALVWAHACASGFFKEGVRDNMSFFGEGSFMGNDIAESNQQASYFWSSFYKTVNYVNYFENALDQVSNDVVLESRKNEMLGEARFIRAHAYLYILKYFGYFWDLNSEYGVVLRKEPSTTNNISMARSSVMDTYKFILEDLDFAIQHAPKFNKELNFRGNQLAALALKARVLLDMGNLKEAAKIAQEVIDNTEGVQLEIDYESCFSKNHDSNELIFGRKLDKEAMRYDKQKWIFKGGGLVLSDLAIDLLEDDPRYKHIADSVIADEKFIGMKILKAWNTTDDFGTIFIRLSEIYLIKAEALIRSEENLQEGINALNIIRSRAGITTPLQVASKEALLTTVLNEIFTELSFENGHEWTAMVRFNKVSEYKPNIKDSNRWVCALPSSETSYNYLAKQNPYYVR